MSIKQPRGIVFDQHYTDSLLKIVLGNKQHRKLRYPFVARSRGVNRTDVLLQLLLHGKAYLHRPYWLRDIPDLSRWESEDLIEWIPYEDEVPTLELMATFHEANGLKREHVFDRDFPGMLHERDDLLIHDEYNFTFESTLRKFLYLSPIWESGLRQLNSQATPKMLNSIPSFHGGIPSDPELCRDWTKEIGSHQSSLLNLDLGDHPLRMRPRMGEFVSHRIPDQEIKDGSSETAFLTKYAQLLDCVMFGTTVRRFSNRRKLPIAANSSAEGNFDLSIGFDAEQLFKVQLQRLRYPLIQTMDDVLRLRNSSAIQSYRQVIKHFAMELQGELAFGRSKVLLDFSNEISKSMDALKSLRTANRIANVCFYISIPLALISAFTGLALGLGIIPATATAKLMATKYQKQIEWLTFGRPEFVD